MTRFGVLAHDLHTIEEKVAFAQLLGLSYVRDALNIETYKGNTKVLDAWKAAGIKVVLNINSTLPDKPTPFYTDLVTYAQKFTNIIKDLDPEFVPIVVIENEETNLGYHSGTIEQYIEMLKVATEIAHAHGLQVANGGIHPRGICYYVWKYYKDNGFDEEAETWMNKTFNGAMKHSALYPDKVKDDKVIQYWATIGKLLDAYETDYINIHLYEPINLMGDGIVTIPGCIETMAEFLRSRCGKPVMTNEFGQRTAEPTLRESMMKAFVNGMYRYAICMSEDDQEKGTMGLADGLVLRPNGITFKNYVSSLNSFS